LSLANFLSPSSGSTRWSFSMSILQSDLYLCTDGNPSPKSFPWFVSDVTPADFSYTIRALQQPELWATNVTADEGQADASANETNASSEALKELARRFQDRVQSGQFELSVGLDTPFGMLSALSINAPHHWRESLEMLVILQVQRAIHKSNSGPNLMRTTIWRKSHRSSGSTYLEVHWSSLREI